MSVAGVVNGHPVAGLSSSAALTPGSGPRDARAEGVARRAGSIGVKAAIGVNGASAGGSGQRLGELVRSSRCGLQFDPRISFELWSVLGERIAGRAKTASWWLGDWVAFGERRYGQRYRLAIQATGLDYQTLRNYAVVARRFDLSRRRDNLSLHHHAEVCALPNELQDKWLALAAAHRWSKQELRRRLRQAADQDATTGATDQDASPSVCQLRLSVDAKRQRRWREAASGRNCAFEDWVIQSLDAAAAH